jgi:hypothetical protein
MSTESNNNLSREAPPWMRDMFEELKNDGWMSRQAQTPGCRSNSANSSVSRPRHIQHHEFRRNAPSQWHATRPNAAGHIEILSSLPNKSVAPTQWCLASIFQNPDAR